MPWPGCGRWPSRYCGSMVVLHVLSCVCTRSCTLCTRLVASLIGGQVPILTHACCTMPVGHAFSCVCTRSWTLCTHLAASSGVGRGSWTTLMVVA